ncbi:roadblock/LC7 domain-containing protein [Lipingzhangella sp. LS1_29]|uniref:Roadblock/LC7 domain-containing protein n=1 Tax=Lipingzhangella rawalii TaxID=2055835 RepID=A0ABU2H925_9ACTN|nr:roadblock/LC7 domain-containing protein [Lipingzhangella rawalii]MDS1271350.1 roadblock/LC7 domain-containing protein [Lipingzhangella rawalii]
MSTDIGQLDWLLDQLLERAAGTTAAVLLSADGLLLGSSSELPTEDAEHLAALASGLHSLARGAGEHFHSGQVLQSVVEMERAYLLVTAAGNGACLAVLAEAEANIGLIAYELNAFVNRVGSTLETSDRQTLGAPESSGAS